MQLCSEKTEKGGYLENNFAVIVGDALHGLCHVILELRVFYLCPQSVQ